MEEKILVGLDGSEESWNALNYAISEAKKKNINQITAIHGTTASKAEKEEKEGSEILEKAEQRAKEKGIEIETEVLVAGVMEFVEASSWDPATAIVRYAEENDYDHIIIGNKGRSGIERILLGSMAEKIVRKAHCLVTVVRKPQD